MRCGMSLAAGSFAGHQIDRRHHIEQQPVEQCRRLSRSRSTRAHAMDHLLSLGHQRIGMLAYTVEPNHYKATSFRKALKGRDELRPQDVWHVPLAKETLDPRMKIGSIPHLKSAGASP